MRSSTGSDSGIISEMLKTKSGKIGIAMLLALVLLSVSVLVSTPIDTLQEWNDPSVWLERPKSAMPVWVNALPIGERMPEHVILRGIAADSTYHDGIHVAEQNFVIQYDYDGFPSDIIYEYAASYTGSPLLKINIERPILTEPIATVTPMNSASGVPHAIPIAKSRRRSSVPSSPYALPPRINVDSVMCAASGAPYKLVVILYVPCSGSYTSAFENTMDSDEIP